MKIPLQITFHGVAASDTVEQKIREAAANLEQFHDDIMSCRVVVEAPHRRHRKGTLYHLRIDVSVTGQELVVNRDPGDRDAHEDVYVMIRDAFAAMERQLRELSRKKQGEVKRDLVAPHGVVVSLFPETGYGFIETGDGREIYFHKNSVLDSGFSRLTKGTEVRFSEEEGEKGPQASSVEIVGKEAKHTTVAHALET